MRKPRPEPIRVIKEKKRLVLRRSTGEHLLRWSFMHKDYVGKHYPLQDWLDYFEKDENYTWTIEYVTNRFIIMVREKWGKQSREDLKKELGL